MPIRSAISQPMVTAFGQRLGSKGIRSLMRHTLDQRGGAFNKSIAKVIMMEPTIMLK
jgi:hypothetical protein